MGIYNMQWPWYSAEFCLDCLYLRICLSWLHLPVHGWIVPVNDSTSLDRIVLKMMEGYH